MQKHHLIVAVLAFLMTIISVYYGTRIYNANQNFLISNLNEIDKIYYDDVKLVPALTRLAAIVTAPFILAITVFQLLILRKAVIRQIKNIALGLSIGIGIILILDVLTLYNPVFFEFSKWGFVWVCLGLFLIAGNVFSVAILKFRK